MNCIYDDLSKKILLNSKFEMLNLNHPYIGSEHLMLSILKFSFNRDKIILNKFGITYDTFLYTLKKIIGVGNRKSSIYFVTPLLKNIINKSFLYCDENFVNSHSLLLSLLYDDDCIAVNILLNMNIDVFKLRYNLSY